MMCRFVFFLPLYFTAFGALGAFAQNLPDSFSYTEYQSLKKEWRAPTLRTLATVRALLAKSGQTEVDPDPKIQIPSLSIFSDDEMEHPTFLKVGITVSHPEVIGKIFPMEDGFLYHGKMADTDTDFALFVTDVDLETMQKLVSSLETALASKSAQSHPPLFKQIASLFLENEAYASEVQNACKAPEREDEGPLGNAALPILRSYRKVVDSFEHKTFREGKKNGWLRCPWGLLSGTWNGTFGAIWDLANDITRIGRSAVHAVKDPRSFWKRTVDGFKNIISLFKHFNLKKILGHLFPKKGQSIPGEQTQQTCRIFAEVAVGFGTSFIPVTAAASIAQKSILLYRHSSNYQSLVSALKGTDKAAKVGENLEKEAQMKPIK